MEPTKIEAPGGVDWRGFMKRWHRTVLLTLGHWQWVGGVTWDFCSCWEAQRPHVQCSALHKKNQREPPRDSRMYICGFSYLQMTSKPYDVH